MRQVRQARWERGSRGVKRAFVAVLVGATTAGAQAPAPKPPVAAPPTDLGPADAKTLPTTERVMSTIEQRLAQVMGRPGGLTADQVGVSAARTSYDATAKLADVQAAEADVDRAVMAFVPRLTLLARYTRLSPVDAASVGPGQGSLVGTTEPAGPLPPGAPLFGIPADAFSFPVILDQYLLNANLTVPLSDYVFSTSKAYAASSSSRRAAHMGVKAARTAAAANAKVAYYNWVRAKLQLEVAKEAKVLSNAQLSTAKLAFDAGRVSNVDVLRAEAQVANSDLLVEKANSFVEITEEQVRVAMHEPSSKPLQVGESVLGPRPGDREAAGLDALVKEALAKRQDIRALDETAWSLKKQSEVVSAQALPKVEAFGNAYYSNPNQRVFPQTDRWSATWDVGLQVTWSPNDLGTSPASARGVDAQRAKILAQRRLLLDGVRMEILQARQAMSEAHVAAATSRRALVAVEEAYRVRRQQYEFGRATSLELSDAEVELLRARMALIDAHIGLRVARVQLDHAVGRDAR